MFGSQVFANSGTFFYGDERKGAGCFLNILYAYMFVCMTVYAHTHGIQVYTYAIKNSFNSECVKNNLVFTVVKYHFQY